MRILLRILRHKIGARLYEPESKIVDLRGEMITQQFGEYNYTHETGTTPEAILYWVRDYTAIFKKEISFLIKCNLIIIDDISRINVAVGGEHGQGASIFPIKLFLL